MKRRAHGKPLTTTTSGPGDLSVNNGQCNNVDDTWQEKQKLRIIRDIKLERIRDTIKGLQTQTLQRMDDQLTALMDTVLGELERYDGADREDVVFNGKAEPEERGQGRGQEKKFLARASPLSELMEVRHIRSLYHMFIAALIVALVGGAVGDALTGGWKAVRIGVRHVPTSFGGFDRSLILWIFMFVSSCLVHPLLVTWVRIRNEIASPVIRWCYNRVCILALMSMITIGSSVVVRSMGDMAPASSVFLLLEQTRFLMKVHAFVRSNVVRAPYVPPFSKYLYFLFAPTLVYRDTYPRTSHIRWRFIGGCLVEFFGAILMMSCITELHFLPEYSNFGIVKQTRGSLAASITRSVLPASLFSLCGFYLLLHAWLNAWAEALRFADRRFYGAWWNATSYGEFYRTWNSVVHDYLHTYIYRDVRQVTNNAVIGKIAVFAVSAVVHEYILALMLGFCYPVMFAQFFGVGAALGCMKSAVGGARAANIFLWVSLACGLGIQYSMYSMEAFARINCPRANQDFIDYFIPRSWTCNGLNL